MLDQFPQWLLGRPRTWIAVCTVLLLIFSAGIPRLRLVTDYRAYFELDDPNRQAFEQIEADYTGTDGLLLALAPRHGDVFTHEVLALVAKASDRLWQTPYVERVESLTDFPFAQPAAGGLDVYTIRDSLDRLNAADLAGIRATALASPLLSKTLVSPDGRVAALQVTINRDGVREYRQTRAVMGYVRALEQEIAAAHPEVETYLTGVVAYNHSVMEIALHDLLTLLPISMAIAVVLLLLLLRNLMLTVACSIVVVFAVVSGVGLAAWIGIPMNGANIAGPIAVQVIALAYCVHIADSFQHLRHANPANSTQECLVESLQLNMLPVLLTAITTMIGFLCLNLGISPPYNDLGNTIAIGVGFGWLYCMLLLAPLTLVLKPRPTTGPRFLSTMIEWHASHISRPLPRWISASLIALTLSGFALIPLNHIDDNIAEWFDHGLKLRRDTEAMDQRLTGMFQLYYALPARSAQGVNDPKYLREVEQFADWYRQQPQIVAVRTLPDLVKQLNQTLHGNRRDAYRIPEDAAMVGQLLALYGFSSPPEQSLRRLINEKNNASRLHVSMHPMPGTDLQAIDSRAMDWLRTHAPDILPEHGGSSPPMMFSYIAQRNIPWMLLSMLIEVVLIVLIMMLAFRSAGMALLSAVWNLVPICVAFGAWALLSGHVGIALSIVSCATFGIIVDDTIHLLTKYQHARKHLHMNAEQAVHHTIAHVGTAVTITSAILVMGFSMLGFSHLPTNAEIGAWVALSITLGLAFELVLMPQLLIRLKL